MDNHSLNPILLLPALATVFPSLLRERTRGQLPLDR